MILTTDYLRKLSSEKNLNAQDYRVLFHICAEMNMEDFVHLKESHMCEDLGLNHNSLVKSLTKLKNLGLLRKTSKGGKTVFMLNTDPGWES